MRDGSPHPSPDLTTTPDALTQDVAAARAEIARTFTDAIARVRAHQFVAPDHERRP